MLVKSFAKDSIGSDTHSRSKDHIGALADVTLIYVQLSRRRPSFLEFEASSVEESHSIYLWTGPGTADCCQQGLAPETTIGFKACGSWKHLQPSIIYWFGQLNNPYMLRNQLCWMHLWMLLSTLHFGRKFESQRWTGIGKRELLEHDILISTASVTIVDVRLGGKTPNLSAPCSPTLDYSTLRSGVRKRWLLLANAGPKRIVLV